MRIGIDIDGVMVNIEEFMLDYGSKYFIRQNVNLVAPDGYDIHDIFDVSKEYEDEFWDKFIQIYLKKRPREFVGEVIRKLKSDGNKIFIITARSTENKYISAKKMQEDTIAWLKEYNIDYDEIIFTSDKVSACVDNHIDLMIEDSNSNIKAISEILPVIVFDAKYNKSANGRNIYRAYTWYDVYYQIHNNLI